MKYRKLGNTGSYVSSLSFGTMFFGGAQWQATPNPVTHEEGLLSLKKAYDLGINYIDCADIYGAYGNAEKIIGEYIKDYERSDFFISSKTFLPMSPKPNNSGLSRKHIFESCNTSLDRLGTDHIDLYYAHRYDFSTSLEEVVEAMNDLIKQGKIMYWGTSNWEAPLLERAFGIANKLGLQGPVVDQAKYSMLQRYSAEVELPYTMDYYGLGVVAYKVLCDQLLTSVYANKSINIIDPNEIAPIGRFVYGNTDEEKATKVLNKLTQLNELALGLGVTFSQLAIAWVLKNRHVSSAIISTRNIDRIQENVDAINVIIDQETDKRISDILDNEPMPDLSYRYVGYWHNKYLVQKSKDEENTYPPKPNKF